MKKINIYKIGWFTCYLLLPLQALLGRLVKYTKRMYDRVSGRWWCDGCDCHHARRTVQYYPDGWGEGLSFCNLHVDPDCVHLYKHIRLGNRNVTNEVKEEYRRQSGLDEAPPAVSYVTWPEAKRAAKVLGDFCTWQSGQGGCSQCNVLGFCADPPYTWEVTQ